MSKIYTYAEARHNLATLLEQAANDGEVRISRRDGQVFVIRPADSDKSPLDVEGIALSISRDEILQFVREGRRFITE